MCFENTEDRAISYWGRVKEDLIVQGLENWLVLNETEDVVCNEEATAQSPVSQHRRELQGQMTCWPWHRRSKEQRVHFNEKINIIWTLKKLSKVGDSHIIDKSENWYDLLREVVEFKTMYQKP